MLYMTQYFPYGVKLSQGQKEKISRAYTSRSPITLRLEKSDLKGNNDELMLTKTQIKRIKKAMGMNKGVDIKISKTQIRKVLKHGGSLWSSLAGLALPLAKKALPKIAAPLASGALSGLASVGVNKLFGSGFLIPDSKVNQLIQYKDLLTAKQKRDILNALQTGSGVHIKPTKKQMGTGIGTILASIGIPMLLDAVMGKGLQVDSNRSRRSVPVKIPPKQGGKMYPQFPYQTPPFYGTWDQIGMGKKKNKKKKARSGSYNRSIRNRSGYGIQQKRLVKNPSVRSTHIKFEFIPLSNFDLINWVNQLGIKHFRGVFSKDDLPSEINEPEVGIINLDSKIGPGTHWVCYRNDDKHLCEYFDSFGLIMPNLIRKYLLTSGEKIIYSTDEIQERDSVLCGYWCLYYLLERQKGRSILQILHNTAFDPNDKSKFIIRYFKKFN